MLECAVPPPVRAPCKRPPRDRRWSLAVAVLGSSLAFLDGTVVNVALPVMQRELGIGVDRAQWVVEAYALLLASLVLVGGALGDQYGRRRVFSIGVIVFALASIGCAVAPNSTGAIALIAARAVQGVGAAMLVPGSLALVSAAFPETDRGAAIGTWSAFSSITTALGPVAGGYVVAHASWRWLFAANIPIAALVLLLAHTRVDETRDESAATKLDWPGAILATLGLALIVFALIESSGARNATRTGLFLLIGAAALLAFVVVEARSTAPMVPLSLFRSPTFAGANALTLLLYAALGGAFFFVPFNLIQVQRFSPAAAGAALLPLVLLLSIMSRPAGAWASRIGPRTPLVLGPLIAAIGFVLFAIPPVHGPHMRGSYWVTVFPGVTTLGVGLGLTVAPLTTAVMGAVDRAHAGVASGINNAIARAANVLAIAIFGVILRSRFEARLDRANLSGLALQTANAQRDKLAAADFSALDAETAFSLRTAFDEAFVSGFRVLMIVAAALAAAGALTARLTIQAKCETRSPKGDGPPVPRTIRARTPIRTSFRSAIARSSEPPSHRKS